MAGSVELSARCDCGALSISISAPPVVQLVCHCHECQAFFRRPYVGAAFFRGSECEVHGKVDATTLKGGTGFDKTHCACAKCNTPLYVTVSALKNACAISADRIASFTFEPIAHLWTSQKRADVTIPGDILQSPGAPPEEVRDIMLSGFWDQS